MCVSENHYPSAQALVQEPETFKFAERTILARRREHEVKRFAPTALRKRRDIRRSHDRFDEQRKERKRWVYGLKPKD